MVSKGSKESNVSGYMSHMFLKMGQSLPYDIFVAMVMATILSGGARLPLYFLCTYLLLGVAVNQVLKYGLFYLSESVLMKRPSPPPTGCDLFDLPSTLTSSSSSSPTPGMPSGHAQALCFAATFASLYMYRRFRGERWIFVAMIAMWGVVALVMRSRVTCGCHTPLQVGVGACIGVGLGYLAYLYY